MWLLFKSVHYWRAGKVVYFIKNDEIIHLTEKSIEYNSGIFIGLEYFCTKWFPWAISKSEITVVFGCIPKVAILKNFLEFQSLVSKEIFTNTILLQRFFDILIIVFQNRNYELQFRGLWNSNSDLHSVAAFSHFCLFVQSLIDR